VILFCNLLLCLVYILLLQNSHLQKKYSSKIKEKKIRWKRKGKTFKRKAENKIFRRIGRKLCYLL
jgi:hypothetical protein